MGLDYLHRICHIIHTDLKPENVVFAQNEGQHFQMLFDNVLNTNLVHLYDSNDPIALNKKQLKNQKKNQKKKQKKQAEQQEEETKEAKIESKPEAKSRKETLIAQMRETLTNTEQQMKTAHVYEIKRRSNSMDKPFRKGRKYRYRLLEWGEDYDNKVVDFMHPTRRYKRYLN